MEYREEEIVEDRMFVFQYIKLLVAINEKTLEDTVEFRKCLNSVNNDQMIAEQLRNNEIVVLGIINRLTARSFFIHILTILLYNYAITKNIDSSLLNVLYNDFEKFFYERTIDIITVSALKGFTSYDSSLDSIQLSDNISIRKLSLDEKISIYQRWIPLQMLPVSVKWVLEHKTTLEKNLSSGPRIKEGFDIKMVESTFASVITSMRLFQEGPVGINSFNHYIPLNIPVYAHSKFVEYIRSATN